MAERDDALVRVATIGGPHGLRGEVRLHLHTDDPQQRLRVGETFGTDSGAGALTIAAVRRHRGTYLVRFEGHPDRTSAEALTATVLWAEPAAEPGAWYPDQLRGLAARAPDGTHLGTISAVQHMPAQDLLVLSTEHNGQVLVPFVHQIVPEVDTAAGYLVIDAPEGLLEDES